jgi:hypothetical protein
MSVQAITWAIQQDIPSSSQKLVLICLANYADSDGVCFPGQKKLAEDASMTDRSIRTALAGLEAAGLICRQRRQREDGSRTSDEYRLLTNRKNLPQGGEPTGKNTSDLPEKTGQTNRKNLPGNEPVREPSDTQKRVREENLDQEILESIWQAYPNGGKVSASPANLPFMLTRPVQWLGSSQAVLQAVKGYAAECRKEDTKPKSLANFLADRALLERYASPAASGTNWRGELILFRDYGDWRPDGPEPGKPGCKAPPDLLEEFGYAERAA